MTERWTSSVRSFGILANEHELPKIHVPKHKDAPIMTEARALAVADALDPKDREVIRERAKEEAARIMAEWEQRMGR